MKYCILKIAFKKSKDCSKKINTEWSALNKHTRNIKQAGQVVFLYLKPHTHVRVHTNEHIHKHAQPQTLKIARWYGRVWRKEEGEGEDMQLIIVSKK